MTAAALLAALQTRGVRLAAVGDRLRVEAPRGVLTAADRAALAAHKAALLALLRADADPWPALLQRFRAAWLAVGQQYDNAPPAERQRLAVAFARGQAFEHAWQRQDLPLAREAVLALEQLARSIPSPAQAL